MVIEMTVDQLNLIKKVIKNLRISYKFQLVKKKLIRIKQNKVIR